MVEGEGWLGTGRDLGLDSQVDTRVSPRVRRRFVRHRSSSLRRKGLDEKDALSCIRVIGPEFLEAGEEGLEGRDVVSFDGGTVDVAIGAFGAISGGGAEEGFGGDVSPWDGGDVLLDWMDVAEGFEKRGGSFEGAGVDGVDDDVGLREKGTVVSLMGYGFSNPRGTGGSDLRRRIGD